MSNLGLDLEHVLEVSYLPELGLLNILVKSNSLSCSYLKIIILLIITWNNYLDVDRNFWCALQTVSSNFAVNKITLRV